MTKAQLLQQIIAVLTADFKLQNEAARTAHVAATHEECQPDNKYDTTALEASYLAQGQANRAQEIRLALESYRRLELQTFAGESPIRLTALVTLEDEDGAEQLVFLGPEAGGLKIGTDTDTVTVITPQAPLGKALIGKLAGEEIILGSFGREKTYCITDIC
jgi:transcription elongation GreA/GreB family factor